MAPSRDLSVLVTRGTATGKRWSAGKAGMSGNKACGLSTRRKRNDYHTRTPSIVIAGQCGHEGARSCGSEGVKR